MGVACRRPAHARTMRRLISARWSILITQRDVTPALTSRDSALLARLMRGLSPFLLLSCAGCFLLAVPRPSPLLIFPGPLSVSRRLSPLPPSPSPPPPSRPPPLWSGRTVCNRRHHHHFSLDDLWLNIVLPAPVVLRPLSSPPPLPTPSSLPPTRPPTISHFSP